MKSIINVCLKEKGNLSVIPKMEWEEWLTSR
jgi:hypothetical protein